MPAPAPAHTHSAAPSTVATAANPLQVTAATTPRQRWIDPEGRRYALRALQAQDTALLGSLWNDGLSAPARFNRFHASLGRIGPARLAAWCQPNAAQGEALVITQLLPGEEQAVAEGRWAWTGEPGQADLSMSVADRLQGWGLGRRMLQALLLAAQDGGAQVLHAQVLLGNGAMQALLQQAGFVARVPAADTGRSHDPDHDGSTLSFERPLLRPAQHRLHLARRAAHIVARGSKLWQLGLDHVATAAIALRLHLSIGLDTDGNGGGGAQRNPSRSHPARIEALN